MGLPLTTLRGKVERAIFREARPTYDLTYRRCRFCGVPARRARGLWQYSVRHYVCDDCRGVILIGRHPRRLAAIADDNVDAEIARRRLTEIREHPERLITGAVLVKRLKQCEE